MAEPEGRPGTYGTVMAQARGVELRGRVVISVPSAFLADQVARTRRGSRRWRSGWRAGACRVPVDNAEVRGPAGGGSGETHWRRAGRRTNCWPRRKANPAVQTLLEIFPAEIKDVTELK